MRGLLKAALVLAPALASAFVVPDIDVDQDWEDERPVADHSFALIGVEVPNDSRSPDRWWESQALGFRLDVLPSEEACGHGNITLNGQVLPQTLDGDVLKGEGSISTDRKGVVVASWTLHCIQVNNQPDSQFLKFRIDVVDGKAVKDVGFSALFRQTGMTEIVNINTDLSIPDVIAANPNPDGLLPASDNAEYPQYGVEDDMAELDWMYAQLYELKIMIAEKQQAIASHAYEHSEDFDIKHCDSLKCIVTTVVQKVKHTAHDVYGKIAGDEEAFSEEFGHFPKPPFKKPHWPKIPKLPFHPGKGKHGNHTCGGPKNGTNHTHPPPHWRKPHHFLPICRLPPHHGPPHHKPPHHSPPPPHDGPPHRAPPSHGGPPPPPPHSPPPPYDGPPHRAPPSHGGPPLPPPHHQAPFHDGPGDDEKPSTFRHGPPSHEDRPPPPPSHNDFGPPSRHNRPGKILHIVKFIVIGFLCAFLLLALHRRACTPKMRADRKARREERNRRRALRRSAHKHAISRLLSRISGNQSDNESTDDYEEKREQLLSDAEDGMSTTMTDEIAQFRNAASVVDDMVSAEEGRARTIAYAHGQLPEPIPIPPREESALIRDYDIGSQIGDGEELPAYEDNDGSEMGSMVADGFRYTPGSSDYSPANSDSGSVNDILGPDTKT